MTSKNLMWLNQEMAPDDSVVAECLARKSKTYIVIDGKLYHKGANGMTMKCVLRLEGLQLLQDIHGGI